MRGAEVVGKFESNKDMVQEIAEIIANDEGRDDDPMERPNEAPEANVA